MLEETSYHKLLRISSAVVAAVLLFQAGFVSSTTALMARGTQEYMANAVGVFVGVAPTELNEITSQITEQRLALNSREQAIAEREIAIGLSPGQTTASITTTFILAGILFILLVLIILNYALDYVRARDERLKRSKQTLVQS